MLLLVLAMHTVSDHHHAHVDDDDDNVWECADDNEDTEIVEQSGITVSTKTPTTDGDDSCTSVLQQHHAVKKRITKRKRRHLGSQQIARQAHKRILSKLIISASNCIIYQF